MAANKLAPEQYLALPGGRNLAYAEAGNRSSSILVLHFHGYLSTGSIFGPPKALFEKDAHYIAPTLPGWGTTSPRNKVYPYQVELAADITTLVDHFHSNDPSLKIYISGFSFGSVPAQMLYGAPFEVFPYGRNIVGCLLMCPFSPYRYHKDYRKTMGLRSYIAHLIPFNILLRLLSFFMQFKLKTVEGAGTIVRGAFDKMDADERAMLATWTKDNGQAEGSTERNMAEVMVKSVSESWEGFLEGSAILHSDWGFEPATLDEEHTRRPLLIVASVEDRQAPIGMAEWIESAYKNSHLQRIKGSHLSPLYYMDNMWHKLFTMTSEPRDEVPE